MLETQSFEATVDNREIVFSITSLENSYYISVTEKSQKVLKNCSLSIQSRYEKFPSSTSIFSDDNELVDAVNSISAKISEKYKRPVYLSWNLKSSDIQVEAALFTILKQTITN